MAIQYTNKFQKTAYKYLHWCMPGEAPSMQVWVCASSIGEVSM